MLNFNGIDNDDVNLKEINTKLNQIILNQESSKNQFNVEIISKIDESLSELKLMMSTLHTEIKEIRTDIDSKLKNVGSKIENIGATVKKPNIGLFIWSIENICRQQSDSFYTHENGYKMRLQLSPERYWIRHGISISVKMVQGANDKSLQWPVEFDVRIGIINQDNGQFFKSDKQIILFRTSTSTHETPFKFTPYDVSGSAWKNGSLLIKCLVN